MKWYINFAEKYLGVKYEATLFDFLKFAWPILLTTGLAVLMLVTLK